MGGRTVELLGDMVITSYPTPPAGAHGLGANGRHVLFLNTEGADLRPADTGSTLALENASFRMVKDDGVISLPPYRESGAERVKNVLQIHKLVSGWYADMNVDVVISRPLSGDYMMTVIGGKNSDLGFPNGVAGISPGDCRNTREQELNYAFSQSAGSGEDPFTAALTAAHEAGHAYGLGHTQNKRDLMYPAVQPETDGFVGGQVADAGPCRAMPGDVQDSKQVLIDNLGERPASAAKPGGTGPTVRFITPKDLTDSPEATMAANDLTIAVKVQARLPIDHVTLSVSRIEGGKARGGHPVAELRPPASAARIKLTVAGDYLITATAYDTASNAGIAQSKVKVPALTCAQPNDCAPGQACQSGTCVTPDKKEGRKYGQACNASSECEGGICAITPVGQLCTHYCNRDWRCASAELACIDGICLPPVLPVAEIPAGALGAKCTRNGDCGIGTECSAASLTDPMAPRYCTKECDPGLAWSCPAGMYCTNTDGAGGTKNRCVLGTQGGGGGGGKTGCSAAGTQGQARGWTGLLLLALLALPRLRRRGAALDAGPRP
jgi:MYXO-CTERM domain-containing protein